MLLVLSLRFAHGHGMQWRVIRGRLSGVHVTVMAARTYTVQCAYKLQRPRNREAGLTPALNLSNVAMCVRPLGLSSQLRLSSSQRACLTLRFSATAPCLCPTQSSSQPRHLSATSRSPLRAPPPLVKTPSIRRIQPSIRHPGRPKGRYASASLARSVEPPEETGGTARYLPRATRAQTDEHHRHGCHRSRRA